MNVQKLTSYDIPGFFEESVPKFIEQYKNLAPEIIDGFSAFTRSVRDGSYPESKHCFAGGNEIVELYPLRYPFISSMIPGNFLRCLFPFPY